MSDQVEGLVTSDDRNAATAQLLQRSGAHPAYVYGVRACGFWANELNPELWDREEHAVWAAAIAEYSRLHPEAEPF